MIYGKELAKQASRIVALEQRVQNLSDANSMLASALDDALGRLAALEADRPGKDVHT